MHEVTLTKDWKNKDILTDELHDQLTNQRLLHHALSYFGRFTGGVLLGISSGGGVYTSYLLLAQPSFVGSTLSFLGSFILASSWATIFSHQPGPKLIEKFADNSQQKAIKKILSKLRKDTTLLKWFAMENTALQNTLNSPITEQESKNLINNLLYMQLKAVVARSIYQQQAPQTNTDRAYLPIQTTSILSIHGHILPSSDISAWPNDFDAQQAKCLIQIMQNLDPQFPITFDFSAKPNESSEDYLSRIKSSIIPPQSSQVHWQFIGDKYANKIKKTAGIQRHFEHLAWLLGATYVSYVYTFCLFFGGIGFVTSLFSLFSVSLAYTTDLVVGSLFGLGAFVGGWFLNKTKTIKMTKQFFKNRRKRKPHVQDAFSQLAKIRNNPKYVIAKDRLKVLPNRYIKWGLASLTTLAFSGFNIITGMATGKLIQNPASIHDIGALLRSVLNVGEQSFLVLLSGFGSAAIAFLNFLPFMIHFASATEPRDETQQSAITPGIIWAFVSNLLSTFTIGVSFFATNTWFDLFEAMGLNAAFTYAFGCISLSSMTFICWFVFSDTVPVNAINSAFSCRTSREQPRPSGSLLQEHSINHRPDINVIEEGNGPSLTLGEK